MKAIIKDKRFLHLPVFLLVACILTFSSCKKSSPTSTLSDDSVAATDMAEATTSMNSATDDASTVAGSVASMSGLSVGGDPTTIGGATVDTSMAATAHVITVHYRGPALGSSLTRTGTVTITLVSGAKWSDPGAVLEINFDNVTYSDAGGSITLNGIHYLTNVTGGLAWKIAAGLEQGTVTHKHTANGFTITFENGTQRIWSVNRLRSYNNTGSVRTITISGDTTVGGQANVDAWGTNRNGDEFTNWISTPIVVSNVCGWFKPYQGQDTQQVADKRTITILFGVDSDGNPVDGGCAYGYKITYTADGKTKTKVVSYWF